MRNIRFHPAVGIAYFLILSCLTMLLFNPWTVAFCVLGELLHLVMLTNLRQGGRLAVTVVCLSSFFAVVNALFNAWGNTPLLYINDRPFTLEALARGALTGGMMSAMLLIYMIYTKYVDNGKFLYVFGRILPTFSLMLSMTLRFIPYFHRKLEEIRSVQQNLGISTETGSIRRRMRAGTAMYWGMFSRALEDSMDTHAAMRARGYGSGIKSRGKRYLFGGRDVAASVVMGLLAGTVVVYLCMGSYGFVFYPELGMPEAPGAVWPAYGAYGALVLLPIFYLIWEELRWKRSSKYKI